jgi:saccharopine dehydrogenase (NAD+, L-lysine forming)
MVSPREVVAACLPEPATIGAEMTGVTCAGLWVRETGNDGAPRQVYLHHVVDNAWSMAEYGSQAVAWQTAVNPVVALELIAAGVWSGAGVLGPEALDAVPFLTLLPSRAHPGRCGRAADDQRRSPRRARSGTSHPRCQPRTPSTGCDVTPRGAWWA